MAEHKVRRLRQVAWVGLVVCALAVLGRIATDPNRWFWDFETYYHAAQVWAEGGNPYDLAELARHSDGRVTHPFLYPLAAMPLLRAFALLPFAIARIAWLVLKLLLLVGIVRLWRERLLRDVDPLLIGFVLVLGFDAALIWELESGNITIIEQVLLWGGLACFLRRRYALFAALVVAASLIKLTLIVFLGLLIFAPGNRRGRIAASAVALLVFGVLAAVPLLARPDLHQAFAQNLSGLREITPLNSSAFFRCGVRIVGPRGRVAAGPVGLESRIPAGSVGGVCLCAGGGELADAAPGARWGRPDVAGGGRGDSVLPAGPAPEDILVRDADAREPALVAARFARYGRGRVVRGAGMRAGAHAPAGAVGDRRGLFELPCEPGPVADFRLRDVG